jgi:hypothetical protein
LALRRHAGVDVLREFSASAVESLPRHVRPTARRIAAVKQQSRQLSIEQPETHERQMASIL